MTYIWHALAAWTVLVAVGAGAASQKLRAAPAHREAILGAAFSVGLGTPIMLRHVVFAVNRDGGFERHVSTLDSPVFVLALLGLVAGPIAIIKSFVASPPKRLPIHFEIARCAWTGGWFVASIVTVLSFVYV